MTHDPGITTRDDCLYLKGVVDFSNVTALQITGENWIANQAPADCRLDLSGVDYSNSAGIALLLAWLRSARLAGKQLKIEHLPANLAAIIQLSGLDQTLTAPQKT